MSESFAIERKVLLALKEKRALGKLSAKAYIICRIPISLGLR